MKYSFFITLLLFSFASFAQVKDTGIIITNPKDTSSKVFNIVQEPAQFPGGVEGWKRYLEKNLNVDLGSKYVKIPKGQKTGIATVNVCFVVNKEGKISDVYAESTTPRKVHPALVKEAIRVIKEGPSWVPARQNGKLVLYRHKQSISWAVNEE